MEKSTGILCWLLYPSDDDRLTDTLESFRSWLQHTLQGERDNGLMLFFIFLAHPFNKDAHSSATRMSDAFYGSLGEIFCGNVIVALCMTMSILVRLPAWSNQEYVNMASSTITQGRKMCVCMVQHGLIGEHYPFVVGLCLINQQIGDSKVNKECMCMSWPMPTHRNIRPCKSGYFLFLDMMPLWKKSFPSSTLQVLVDHVDTIVQ